jgi:integrative and conjugative element protein (TIGR02256 family)
VPMRGDRRARCRFDRAAQRHQELIDQAWAASGGTTTYLGEWHTHPEPVPDASSIDAGTWTRKLMTDHYAGCLFFVILGTREVRVWEGGFGREPSLLTAAAHSEDSDG